MHLIRSKSILPLSTLLSAATHIYAQNQTHLIVPALLTSPLNTTSIQCINLTHPFTTSSTPGTLGTQALTLATTNTTYTVLPPRFDGGLHNAPAAQLVHFLSGLVHLTLPQDPEGQELWIVGGKGGLVFAADTVGQGHKTRYPGDEVTVAVVAPFEGGKVPEYSVVKEGVCEGLQTFL
ncbi:hypothetical protein IAQ61_011071 [Plenodomus lingam]|uniref:Cupin type-1 domain-containing protein n=1 Tax=Leptosphaeria maculans (strain JN3 / isolate v23.1.3 / race Av1-4-5-6-7-8) TaxID=985895 RepID=E4ZJI8_LEPMJ|nr:hypothetical protein LEMA_P072870.1 [Plenodomus lingam JN3]KAH9861334.1 hypothetical protein IAQ61_011071 [Plenodomus lingam]CBX91779.1 hypothetical protein LEMA_P072870.1 [Plenodomus lingam JN3]